MQLTARFQPAGYLASAASLAALALSSTAFAAPSVSGVSGTVAHGSSITVSGSGFGSHANYNNISDTWNGSGYLAFRFRDFEDGVLKGHGFYPQSQDGAWSVSASELGLQSGGPANSSKYLRRYYQTGEAGGLSTDVSGAGNQLYTTFKFMMPSGTQAGKFWRSWGANTSEWLSSGCGNYEVRGSSDMNGDTEYGTGPQLTTGKWHRVEIWADAPAKTFRVSVDGQVAWTKSNWLASTLGINGHTIDYPNMLDSGSRDASCPATGSFNYDDIYIDFTSARVELGNASTWSASTKKEVQLATKWADGSISVEVNTGEFNNGDTVYLYVVDSSGHANSTGYAMKINGTLVRPEPPTNVSVQ
jgi:hypothetical protein